MSSLSTEITLPCGLTLPNRLVKAAMAETLADSTSAPGSNIQKLYNAWADGGWGVLLTGNVQVDKNHRGTPGDVALSDTREGPEYEKTLNQWKEWAAITQSKGTAAIVQINHPGRQSPVIARKGKALAPSAVPLNLGPSRLAGVMRWIAFGTPTAMTSDDIKTVVEQFTSTAKLAAEAGFKGVQLHAAHGYLLSQFLSPISNIRTDDYGGSPTNRARIVKEIVQQIRSATPKGFAVGIKINSADLQDQKSGLDDSLEQIGFIQELVDFIEISGGSFENPRMITGDSEPRGGELKATERTFKREAFFLEFAKQVREKYPHVPLIVTGGFRTRQGMQAAIDDGDCDLIGIARPACVQPRLPKTIILNEEIADDQAKVELEQLAAPWFVQMLGVKPLTVGAVSSVYKKHLHNLIKS